MFCIASLIVFGIISIFSASYRPLAAKAWHCTWRRVTLRPCDISFGEEIKGKLLAKVVLRNPRLARRLDPVLDWIAFVFVALSIWSVFSAMNIGLNLWVYDTCNPAAAESCSLSGEACGIDQNNLTLRQAIDQGQIWRWVAGPVTRFADTVSRVPDRLRTWDTMQYLAPLPSFLKPLDLTKPYALEIIDPGCKFCKKLTHNILTADTPDRFNVSYILYPIPTGSGSATKFSHSPLVASYLEAAKRVPFQKNASKVPGDWQLLEMIFADPTDGSIDLQTKINIGMTRDQVYETLAALLSGIGYSATDIGKIRELAASPEVQHDLALQKQIVEKRIRTVKIPTLLIGGRRFDRVIDVTTLKKQGK